MQSVLLLYSGGKDSLLSAYYLMMKGYHVYLIHFDNCSMIGTNQIQIGANILEQRFGKDKITFLGIDEVISTIRTLKKIENIPLSEILSQYGDITLSQYQCLICRCAMYFVSSVIAQDRNIKNIADGARKSQLFAIEQPPLMESFRRFFKKYDLELLTPVYDIVDNFGQESELWRCNILDCVYESKCMLGYPLKEEVPEQVILGINNVFQKIVEPELDEMMNNKRITSDIKKRARNLSKDSVNWN